MDLAELTSLVARAAGNNDDATLSGRVCFDSRQVRRGDVFVAVRGVQADGHDYVGQAAAAGATVVVAERKVEAPAPVALVQVANSAVALGELAQAQHGWPGRELINLAVTGTNGKTTVAYLTQAMMAGAGWPCGLMGTVAYDAGGEAVQASNTTPDALRLAGMMRQMRENGLGAMVMECSSHGLDQDRVAGIDFKAAAFTNLTGDHYNYHGGRREYLAAKAKLFAGLSEQAVAILNRDDDACDELVARTRGQVWRYGMGGEGEIAADVEAMGIWGCQVELRVLDERRRLCLPMIGKHNVSNLMAAAGLARAAGASLEAIAAAAEGFAGVPGRLERIEGGQGFTVLVDYAHTDDALQRALETVRDLATGRVIVVFGCGGERDRSKRPRMAAVAEEWADRIIVTNDNPRGEDPQRIAEEIRAGFSASNLPAVTELLDRRVAIELAIGEAKEGDVVLIAGKGHEDYQEIAGQKLQGPDYDDREIARGILAGRGGSRPVQSS